MFIHKMANQNSELADAFMKLATYYEGIGENFRAQAYRSASLNIRRHSTHITSGQQARVEVYRIGESSAAKIDEYLSTGTLKLLEQIETKTVPIVVNKDPELSEKQQVLDLFQGIHGVGKVTAEKWYTAGHRTYADLQGVKMTAAQTLGYK